MNPTSLTVSLVPEAKGGPFILWDPLPVACSKAKALGYDAIEVFPPSAEGVDAAALEKGLRDHGLKLAAMGTGAGAVLRKLTLTSPDSDVRRQGIEFVNSVIDFAGRFGAPAILGSMQGRWGGPVDKPTALGHLRTALNEFGERAKKAGTTFLLEPLNRYEGNVVNTIGDAVDLIRSLSTSNVTILADLFTKRGHLGMASLAASPYWLAYYLQFGLLEFVKPPDDPLARAHAAPAADAIEPLDLAPVRHDGVREALHALPPGAAAYWWRPEAGRNAAAGVGLPAGWTHGPATDRHSAAEPERPLSGGRSPRARSAIGAHRRAGRDRGGRRQLRVPGRPFLEPE